MSIIQGVLEIAEGEARKHGAARINEIKLRLGEFCGVVREALDFAFEALKRGTLAADARLNIETIELVVECPDCALVETLKGEISFICPRCGGLLKIITGREMQIEYIDLD